jgi:hypothetical protein
MVFGAKRLPQIIRCGFALLAPRIDIKRGKPLIGDAGAAAIRQAGPGYAVIKIGSSLKIFEQVF